LEVYTELLVRIFDIPAEKISIDRHMTIPKYAANELAHIANAFGTCGWFLVSRVYTYPFFLIKHQV